MKARPRRLLVASLLLGVVCSCKQTGTPRPAPPPLRVLLLRPEPLRAQPRDDADNLVTLATGETLEILKLGDDWVKARTLSGGTGWVHRTSFARRTLVASGNPRITADIADRLRDLPDLDVIWRQSGGYPNATVEAARQLAPAHKAELVIFVSRSASGSGQFIFAVVDVTKGIVLGAGSTEMTVIFPEALDALIRGIYAVVHRGGPFPPPPPLPASPSPLASPTPEAPHPNAPLPVNSPPVTPSPTPS